MFAQLEKTPNVVITTIYRMWSFVVTIDVPIVTGAAPTNLKGFGKFYMTGKGNFWYFQTTPHAVISGQKTSVFYNAQYTWSSRR